MPVTFYPSVVILRDGDRNRVSPGFVTSGGLSISWHRHLFFSTGSYFFYKKGTERRQYPNRRCRNQPWITSFIKCDMVPTTFLKEHTYNPASSLFTDLTLTRLPTNVTRSDGRISWPSLNQVSVGVGDPFASQYNSSVSPSRGIIRLGDTFPRTGDAGKEEYVNIIRKPSAALTTPRSSV